MNLMLINPTFIVNGFLNSQLSAHAVKSSLAPLYASFCGTCRVQTQVAVGSSLGALAIRRLVAVGVQSGAARHLG